MEIGNFISALLLGLASGFHCIGMCGPIALSMGMSGRKALKFQAQNFTYNLGRILTYSILGAVLGVFGKGFQIAGFQQQLSILAGILLIIMAIFSFGGDFSSKLPWLSRPLMKVKIALSKFLQKSDLKSRFFTGILNGLLPCGMVYMALTASLAAGGIWQGALFMALFGAGTFPFMFAMVFFGSFVSQTFRTKVLRIIPVVMIVLGGLFIFRGMNLGVKYLSPTEDSLQVIHNNSMQRHMGDHSSCH